MNTQPIDTLIEELESKLGETSFVTIRQLVDCGIYGSMSGARIALSEGNLPFIQISERRRVIPRLVLLEYLRNNISNKRECASNAPKA